MGLVLGDVEMPDPEREVDCVDVVERGRQEGQVRQEEHRRQREQASAHRD